MEPDTSASSGDAGLLDEILERMRLEGSIDLERLVAEYPDRAEEIRQLAAVVQFVQSNAQPDDPGSALEARVRAGRRQTTLGDFRIEREIARGGMGVVYEAVQQSLNRRVALKVLLPGVTFCDDAIERFGREAKTAGGLSHRHIVPVYAVGEENGVPYYAMQYIEGRSLSEVIRERAERRQAPDAEYVRRVAKWGRQAADALDHAHRAGVVHRDIKPSNMLLGNDDNIWLTDFGLARQDTNATLTFSGDLLGTVRYMSPEQARGGRAVDERTDVYSLGVSLYELVGLRPPFDGPERETVLKQLLLDEPSSLRQIATGIPRPLEIIIHKAMEKDPQRRYPSAAVFAEELQRFLDGRPLLTRPAGPFERFVRLVRRHKFVFGALAALFLIVAGFGVWMSVLYAESDRLRQAAEDGRSAARQAEGIAEQRRAEAEAAAELAQRQARKNARIQEFLESMLGSVDPRTAQGRDDTLLREILNGAALRVDSELAEEPDVQAAVREVIGNTYTGLARYDDAIPLLESVLAYRRQALGGEHRDTLVTLVSLGDAYRHIGRLAEAEEACGQALEIMKRSELRGDTDVAALLNNMAVMYAEQGEFDGAQRMLEQAIEALEFSVGAESPYVLGAKQNLGQMLYSGGKYAEAESVLREALETSRRALGDTDPTTFWIMTALADSLLKLDRAADAEPLAREAAELHRRVLGEDHPEYLYSLSCLAKTLEAQGRWDESEPIRRECYEGALRTSPPGQRGIAVAQSAYGVCLARLGRFEEGETHVLAAFEALRAKLGVESRHTQSVLERVIDVYELWGKPDKAAEYDALRISDLNESPAPQP